MNKNKKITLLTMMIITAFAATGCTQNADTIKADQELANEIVLDTYAALRYDATLAGAKRKGEVNGINVDINKDDFVCNDVIKDSNKKLEGIKNKPLKKMTKIFIDSAKDVDEVIDDYIEGKIDKDEVKEKMDNATDQQIDSFDTKLFIQLIYLSKKYNLEYNPGSFEKNITKRLEDKYGEKLQSMTTRTLAENINSNGLLNNSDDTSSNELTKDAASEINEIKLDASQYDSIDYKKGQYETVDTIAKAISDFYKNGLSKVDIQLYERKTDYDAEKEYYAPISTETKERLENDRQKILNSIKAGHDSTNVSSFYHLDMYSYDAFSNDVTDSIGLNFSLTHTDKEGNLFTAFMNEFASFSIVKENNEVKIVVE